MDKILKLALTLLAEVRLSQRVGQYSGAIVWLLCAAIAGVGAAGAAVAALWIFLVPRIGADGAALSVAVLLACMSGIFVLFARATLQPVQNRNPVEGLDTDLAEIKNLFAENKSVALLAAVVAGLVMGNGRK